MADLKAQCWLLIDAAISDHDRARVVFSERPEVLKHHEYGGETALHYLAVENHAAAVQFLLSMGVSANSQGRFGESPLQEAVLIHARSSS